MTTMNLSHRPMETHESGEQGYDSALKSHARPHKCPKKRLIVACDGTWMDSDSVDQVPSNVTRIVRSIPPIGIDHSGAEPQSISQILYYENGVGTGSGGWYQRYIGTYISGATGEGIAFYIRQTYNFICSNYYDGDEIVLLGFSRGAFIARSISTLINQLGLLTSKGLGHIIEIFDDWEHQQQPDYVSPFPDDPWSNRPSFKSNEYHEMLLELKLTRPRIPIKCVAVWDTVGALGMPATALFPTPKAKEFAFVDTHVEDNIEYAFQALGLDEKRCWYSPTVWFKPSIQVLPKVLKQTWFPGVHSDIGGSYANDDIANLTLAWMVGQLEDYGLVTFDRDYLIRLIHRTIQRHDVAIPKDNVTTSLIPKNHTAIPSAIQRAKSFGPLRKWGLGKIHDSYTLFYRLGGTRTRTPCEHAEYSRATRKPTGRFLQGTHERMHASVRARMALGGKGYDDKGSYVSDALKGWEYAFGATAQPDTPYQTSQPGEVGRLKDVCWTKTIKENGAERKVLHMEEDVMTSFESLVLRHWTDAEDEKEWEAGAEEREEEVDMARPIRRESHMNLEITRASTRSQREHPSRKHMSDLDEHKHHCTDAEVADGALKADLRIATDVP